MAEGNDNPWNTEKDKVPVPPGFSSRGIGRASRAAPNPRTRFSAARASWQDVFYDRDESGDTHPSENNPQVGTSLDQNRRISPQNQPETSTSHHPTNIEAQTYHQQGAIPKRRITKTSSSEEDALTKKKIEPDRANPKARRRLVFLDEKQVQAAHEYNVHFPPLRIRSNSLNKPELGTEALVSTPSTSKPNISSPSLTYAMQAAKPPSASSSSSLHTSHSRPFEKSASKEGSFTLLRRGGHQPRPSTSPRENTILRTVNEQWLASGESINQQKCRVWNTSREPSEPGYECWRTFGPIVSNEDQRSKLSSRPPLLDIFGNTSQEPPQSERHRQEQVRHENIFARIRRMGDNPIARLQELAIRRHEIMRRLLRLGTSYFEHYIPLVGPRSGQGDAYELQEVSESQANQQSNVGQGDTETPSTNRTDQALLNLECPVEVLGPLFPQRPEQPEIPKENPPVAEPQPHVVIDIPEPESLLIPDEPFDDYFFMFEEDILNVWRNRPVDDKEDWPEWFLEKEKVKPIRNIIGMKNLRAALTDVRGNKPYFDGHQTKTLKESTKKNNEALEKSNTQEATTSKPSTSGTKKEAAKKTTTSKPTAPKPTTSNTKEEASKRTTTNKPATTKASKTKKEIP